MQYRYEATTVEGFVQQLSANYLPHGYWFYVTGFVPGGKDLNAVDRKLMEKYGVSLSRQQRARRKQAGLANVHYIRMGQFWVLLCTKGEHRFFEEEGENVRDARRMPIQVSGYSLSVKRGNFLKKVSDSPAVADQKLRVRVQIARERYRELSAYFIDRTCHMSAERQAYELWNVPFEPYAPVRRQMLNLLRLINAKRQVAGYAKISPTVLRYKRRVVRPFGPVALDEAA